MYHCEQDKNDVTTIGLHQALMSMCWNTYAANVAFSRILTYVSLLWVKCILFMSFFISLLIEQLLIHLKMSPLCLFVPDADLATGKHILQICTITIQLNSIKTLLLYVEYNANNFVLLGPLPSQIRNSYAYNIEQTDHGWYVFLLQHCIPIVYTHSLQVKVRGSHVKRETRTVLYEYTAKVNSSNSFSFLILLFNIQLQIQLNMYNS